MSHSHTDSVGHIYTLYPLTVVEDGKRHYRYPLRICDGFAGDAGRNDQVGKTPLFAELYHGYSNCARFQSNNKGTFVTVSEGENGDSYDAANTARTRHLKI